MQERGETRSIQKVSPCPNTTETRPMDEKLQVFEQKIYTKLLFIYLKTKENEMQMGQTSPFVFTTQTTWLAMREADKGHLHLFFFDTVPPGHSTSFESPGVSHLPLMRFSYRQTLEQICRWHYLALFDDGYPQAPECLPVLLPRSEYIISLARDNFIYFPLPD